MAADTYRKRMRDLGKLFRAIGANRVDPLLTPQLDRLAQMDLRMKDDLRRLRLFMKTRMMSGAGLQMSNLLRQYFQEYNARFSEGGAEWLPSSFNVLEAFFPFSRKLLIFDLVEEEDYILSLIDYMDWYTRGGLPEEFRLVADSLREGVAHSYNIIGDAGNFIIEGNESDFLISGLSLVRRGPEIVALMLAGQRGRDSGSEESFDPVDFSAPNFIIPAGKKNLRPAPGLTSQDRFLEGMGNFARILVATRINVDQGTHDVRYIFVDQGPAFSVLTDDPRTLKEVSHFLGQKGRETAAERLSEYECLFSALLSMLYLPVYFGEKSGLIVRHQVATMLRGERRKDDVRAALREFGERVVIFERPVTCLSARKHYREQARQQISAPDLQFSSSGYWRSIGPDEIGEDPDGKPMFGKTWVHEQANWVQTPAARMFTVEIEGPGGDCPDPGYVYVMRSVAQVRDIYKIGLTRRTVEKRAGELSRSTASPTEFLEIASWAVGDCGAIERKIHDRLDYCRINKRREFFRAPLSRIIREIELVIAGEE